MRSVQKANSEGLAVYPQVKIPHLSSTLRASRGFPRSAAGSPADPAHLLLGSALGKTCPCRARCAQELSLERSIGNSHWMSLQLNTTTPPGFPASPHCSGHANKIPVFPTSVGAKHRGDGCRAAGTRVVPSFGRDAALTPAPSRVISTAGLFSPSVQPRTRFLLR